MWLTIVSGEGRGLAVRIEGERFLVGSSRDCRLVIHDDAVAAIHAVFEERDDGAYYVHDLDTEAGTFVRGARIDAPARLGDGDEVRIGGTILAASRDEPEPDAAVEVQVPAAEAAPQPDEDAVALVTAPEGSHLEVVPARQRRQLRDRVRLALGLAAGAAVLAVLAVLGVLLLTGEESQRSVESVVREVTPSTVIVKSGVGTGSGWVLDAPAGLVVTNFHVINGGGGINVVGQGAASEAKVVGAAPCDDLAVLRVEDNTGLRTLPLADEEDVDQGESVVALGYPANASDDDTLTSTAGVVSVVRSSFQFSAPDSPRYPNVVQTDAALSPGNSGGPLVDRSGRLVGVNTAILTAIGNAPIEGQGYAIGVDRVKQVVPGLRAGRSKGWVGFGFAFVDDRTAEKHDLPRKGIPITAAAPGTPAESARIPADGALLLAVGDRVLEGTLADYCDAVSGLEPGQTVPITIVDRAGAKPRLVPVPFD